MAKKIISFKSSVSEITLHVNGLNTAAGTPEGLGS